MANSSKIRGMKPQLYDFIVGVPTTEGTILKGCSVQR